MARIFGGVMAKMSEEDLARYVNQTILNGEFATLQGMPEIAEALVQAQTKMDEAASTTGHAKK